MQAFDEQPHLQLLKEMLTHMFATPKRHSKSKPFHDHVLTFSMADNRVWLRNYQVCAALPQSRACSTLLILMHLFPCTSICMLPLLCESHVHTLAPDNRHDGFFLLHSGKLALLQIVSEAVKKGAAAEDGMSLVEVGPRVCLQPIKIFAGSFGGPVLYENPAYVSPNKVRHSLRHLQIGACAGKPLLQSQRVSGAISSF